MMMRSMKWLRVLAISAGVISAFYGYFFLLDFVTVFWEVIFVSVNLLQLLILEFENRRARFSTDEEKFIKATVPRVERAHAKRLLNEAKHCHLEPGAVLTEEGKPVSELIFIIQGAASIEKGGAMVGVCGHEDFVGEIGFMTGAVASATATVTHSMRGFCFETKKLRALLDKEPSLQQALESSFNRNLVGKLVKSNEGQGASMERALEA